MPLAGRSYYAYHPDKPSASVTPSFQPRSPGDLTNGDFAGYEMPAAANGTVDIRVDVRDVTCVVFARNGMPTVASVRVHMGLREMISSTPMPAVVRIPAATEIFLTLLRPVPGARRYGYTCRLETTPML